MLAEKSRVAEEEAMLLSQKATEAEQEITRIRLSNMKTEEEKVHLEQKTRDAVRLTEMLVQESEKRALEEKKLKDELLRARIAEKEAKEKLLEFLSRNAYTSSIPVNIHPSSPQTNRAIDYLREKKSSFLTIYTIQTIINVEFNFFSF